MEIAQLNKSIYNDRLQKSLIFVMKKYVSNMAGEHTLTKPRLKVIPYTP